MKIFYGLRGDLPVIGLLVGLVTIAWYTGITDKQAVGRAIVAGAGVALIAVPLVSWLDSTHSVPAMVLIALFYLPVVATVLSVYRITSSRRLNPDGLSP